MNMFLTKSMSQHFLISRRAECVPRSSHMQGVQACVRLRVRLPVSSRWLGHRSKRHPSKDTLTRSDFLPLLPGRK